MSRPRLQCWVHTISALSLSRPCIRTPDPETCTPVRTQCSLLVTRAFSVPVLRYLSKNPSPINVLSDGRRGEELTFGGWFTLQKQLLMHRAPN